MITLQKLKIAYYSGFTDVIICVSVLTYPILLKKKIFGSIDDPSTDIPFLQDKTIIVEKIENPLIFDKLEYNITGKTQRHVDQLVDDKLIFLTINPDNSKLYYTKKFTTYKIGTGLTTKGSANYLGIIVFAIVVGIAAGSMGERNRPFVDFLLVLNEIITKLIIAVMW